MHVQGIMPVSVSQLIQWNGRARENDGGWCRILEDLPELQLTFATLSRVFYNGCAGLNVMWQAVRGAGR